MIVSRFPASVDRERSANGKLTGRLQVSKETEKERWERNFADLLQELRVAQTGVQILFAFLLTLPFSAQFPRVNDLQRDLYVISLLTAAAATALIISPVAFHRALFRQGRKPELVVYAHRMAAGGLWFMLVAMVSAVFLITDFLLDQTFAYLLTGTAAVWFLTFWIILPAARRKWLIDEEADEPVADERQKQGAGASTSD
jgi:amino acid permease